MSLVYHIVQSSFHDTQWKTFHLRTKAVSPTLASQRLLLIVVQSVTKCWASVSIDVFWRRLYFPCFLGQCSCLKKFPIKYRRSIYICICSRNIGNKSERIKQDLMTQGLEISWFQCTECVTFSSMCITFVFRRSQLIQHSWQPWQQVSRQVEFIFRPSAPDYRPQQVCEVLAR